MQRGEREGTVSRLQHILPKSVLERRLARDWRTEKESIDTRHFQHDCLGSRHLKLFYH